MTCKERATELYSMMHKGDILDAFEKFYHQDVVKIEPGNTRNGKEEARKHELEFIDMVKDFQESEVKSITADEENSTTVVESYTKMLLKNGETHVREETAVQKWKDGLIIHERFYYDPKDLKK